MTIPGVVIATVTIVPVMIGRFNPTRARLRAEQRTDVAELLADPASPGDRIDASGARVSQVELDHARRDALSDILLRQTHTRAGDNQRSLEFQVAGCESLALSSGASCTMGVVLPGDPSALPRPTRGSRAHGSVAWTRPCGPRGWGDDGTTGSERVHHNEFSYAILSISNPAS